MHIEPLVVIAGSILATLTTLVELSPLKLNPWSYLLRYVGNAFNSTLTNKIEVIEKEQAHMRKELQRIDHDIKEQYIITVRERILRFSNETLKYPKVPTKEYFEQILRYVTEYEYYCESHPGFKNSVTTITVEQLKELYKKSYLTL